MNQTLNYFAQHGSISNPGEHASLFDNLPVSTPELVKVVQGVTIHVFWTERYGFKAPPERMGELQLRTMEKRLARTLELDPRPLTEPRPIEKKLLGNCRDHSLLLVSMLRHQGVPARARCGFGTYFLPDHFEDHWVVEYWNAEQNRWIFVDAQLDEFQQNVLKTDFDPLHVPRDRFIVGGKAWHMCRSGEQDPEKFGIFDMHGLGFVRGNLVRDVASLNKVELLPWDCWGIILNESLDNPDDLAVLDEVAALTAGDVPDLDTVRSHFESDPRFRVEGSIVSYVDGNMTQVNLP
jgi:hypothetical protein